MATIYVATHAHVAAARTVAARAELYDSNFSGAHIAVAVDENGHQWIDGADEISGAVLLSELQRAIEGLST